MTVLYHYCSTSAFLSIVESRSIWLSSLSLSNDSLEGKLVAEIVARISASEGLDQAYLENLQDGVTFIEQLFDGLGFCLSEEGDLLSQWRGYASDATGFSLGFSKKYIESLSEALRKQDPSGFSMHKVEYQTDAQEELVRPTYQKVKQIIDDGGLKIPRPRGLLDTRSDEEIEKEIEKFKEAHKSMYKMMLGLLPKLYTLKTPAFREEREWRLISYLMKDANDTCSYRALDNRIVPIRKIDLIKIENDPISEVIIGPKNLTPNYVIEKFLKQHGFENVVVTLSSVTYR